MLFSTKVISASGNLMLNICDPELVGKTLHDGNTKIKINSNYYAERDVDEHEAKNLLTKCNSINMVGEKTISLATSLGLGSEKSVRRIEGVPFLILFKM
ncbi:MAG: DUF424 family protein [Thaumarchaeota archaeon]|jgi:hypothetical protein|nr:DUF424 family protein [Nitrososphaerota archaeon]MBT3743466.1 DUF424 family protein [Nitrososphaerota archaeon]MBT4056780.1 DUF424 family protein [Nitrososphaerota archaeon]MBT4175969.1 DUF424 family protein [Nitrososphaerota archaeon]MBT4509465.1 DUF424 family protein [Nitrososphaerota archaeon]|tara:strand:- start:240 stop:536 length:297 start_codon:yes stop_codon:yes gene_type:complete